MFPELAQPVRNDLACLIKTARKDRDLDIAEQLAKHGLTTDFPDEIHMAQGIIFRRKLEQGLAQNYELLSLNTLPLFENHGFYLGEFFNNFYAVLPGGFSRRNSFSLEEYESGYMDSINETNERGHSDKYLNMTTRHFYETIDMTIQKLGFGDIFSKEGHDEMYDSYVRYKNRNIPAFQKQSEAQPGDAIVVSAMIETYKELRREGFSHIDLI